MTTFGLSRSLQSFIGMILYATLKVETIMNQGQLSKRNSDKARKQEQTNFSKNCRTNVDTFVFYVNPYLKPELSWKSDGRTEL